MNYGGSKLLPVVLVLLTGEVKHFAPLAGALLLRPGSNARILFAGGGPEALAQMLRPAASEYFGKRCKDR